MGQKHSAVVSEDGDLYTFGFGNWGVLGHGNETNIGHTEPKKVEWFAKRGIKVKDIVLGELHSLALSEDGDIYTWGYGGKVGYFAWMFSQEVGALGHNNKKPQFVPKLVSQFKENNQTISHIGAGLYHSVAVTTNGELYTWG
jgi:alpha-tubulin suppressor-like RCC1 family protein